MRMIVLGAAAGGGLPQWNCGCPNCRDARDPASPLPPQTQSSIAVSADSQHWALLNASPDLRMQLERTPALHPRKLRDSPVEAVLLTNSDVDHIAGLLTLREGHPFRLITTPIQGEILAANPVFRVLDPAIVHRETVALDQTFMLAPGLEARIFAVPGKVPLYLEEGEPELGGENEQTVGVELSCHGKRAFYIPGCAALPPGLLARLAGADALLFDGTLFTEDEMIESGTGRKTSRRMGHMPMDGPGGSLAALATLAIGRKVYIHINNTNPVWRDGPERRKVEEARFEIGHDGMEIVI